MLTKSNVSGFTLVPVLFVLTLFLLLSALSISVILAGSTVYEKISDNMDNNYDRRVTFSYLANKIRQNDVGGSISVENKDGLQMLAISETDEIFGDEYVTYIYYYKGFIREIFLTVENNGATVDFNPDWGDEIIKANNFSFDLTGEGIILKFTDSEGSEQYTRIALRSDK